MPGVSYKATILNRLRLDHSHWTLRRAAPNGHAQQFLDFVLEKTLTPGSIYCATKHAVNAFSGSLLRELVSTNVRVAEILPGMVETEFSVVRWRGDKGKADSEYKGITPRE